MSSRLNEMENEGLVVIGRGVGNEWAEQEKVEAVAAAVDAWGAKLGLPLGLVYCGTTINWPDDVEFTPMLIGLITFSGYGDDDEPVAGEVPPTAMDGARGDAIPEAFWKDLADSHGVELSGDVDVYLAAAGWTWTRLEREDGQAACAADTEGSGYRRIPEEARGESHVMKVGYC